jgi:hypothetical protein
MTDMTANSDSAPEVSFDQVKRRLRLDWNAGEHIQIPFIWLRQLAEAQGRSDIARWQQDGGVLSAPRGKL